VKIGARIRALREAKHLSQGDVERKTGLIRPYTSRVENGFTVPNIDSLEKFTSALEIPLYQFVTDANAGEMPKLNAIMNGIGSQHRRELQRFVKAFERLSERDRRILLVTAQKMAARLAKRYRRPIK